MAVRVRPATPADVDALYGLIVELARFHGSEAEVDGNAGDALAGVIRRSPERRGVGGGG